MPNLLLSSPLLNASVKSCFQNMEICKRRSSSYDSGKTLFAANPVPGAAGNLTVTFSSQLNQHNQVRGREALSDLTTRRIKRKLKIMRGS